MHISNNPSKSRRANGDTDIKYCYSILQKKGCQSTCSSARSLQIEIRLIVPSVNSSDMTLVKKELSIYTVLVALLQNEADSRLSYNILNCDDQLEKNECIDEI